MPALLITLDKGQDLPAADVGGTSDPFVLFSIGGFEIKSTTKKKTLNPEWGEDLLLPVEDPEDPLIVEVFDWDAIGKSDSLGRAKIRVDQLVMGRPKSFWVSLSSGQGRVHIIVTAIGFGTDPLLEGVMHDSVKKLIVSVVKAENVSAMDRGGTSDPFMKVTFAGQLKQTQVVKKTTAPEWNEVYAYTVDDQEKQMLTLEMFDKDMFKEKLICKCQLPINNLVRDRSNPITPQMMDAAGNPCAPETNKLLIVLTPSGFGQEANLAEEYHNADLQKMRRMDTVMGKSVRKKGKKRVTKSSARLKLTVLEAKGQIPAGDQIKGIVRVRFEESNTQTEEDNDYDNPFWNENFTFDCDQPNNPAGCWLYFELCDDDTPLGVCKVDVSHCYQGSTSDLELPLTTPGKPTSSRTSEKQDTHEPEWNESFDFDLGLSADRDLEVTVWDADITNDELIGTGTVRLSEVLFPETATRSSKWVGLKHKGAPAGRVQLVFDAPTPRAGCQHDKVNITVVRAEGLIQSDILSKSDPYCMLKMLNQVTACILHVYVTPMGFGRLTADQRAEKEENDRQAAQARGEISGDLQVRAIEARDLLAHDSNGKSDPFLELWVNEQKKDLVKTKVIKKTLTPVWNETFTIRVINYPQEHLSIECFDKDLFGRDSLGTAEVDLAKLEKGKVIDEWVDLSEQGAVHLELTPINFGRVPIPPENPARARERIEKRAKELVELEKKAVALDKTVVLRIIEGETLHQDGQPRDYFVRITHSKQQYSTVTCPKTLVPKWNNAFELIVEDIQAESTIIEACRVPNAPPASVGRRASMAPSASEVEVVGYFKLPTDRLGQGKQEHTLELRRRGNDGEEEVTGGLIKIAYETHGFGSDRLWKDFLDEEQKKMADIRAARIEKMRAQVEAQNKTARAGQNAEEEANRQKLISGEEAGWASLMQAAEAAQKQARSAEERRYAAFRAAQAQERQREDDKETVGRNGVINAEAAARRELLAEAITSSQEARSLIQKRLDVEKQARGVREMEEESARKEIERSAAADWESITNAAFEQSKELRRLEEERAARKLQVTVVEAVHCTDVGAHTPLRVRVTLMGHHRETSIKPPETSKVKRFGNSYTYNEAMLFGGVEPTSTLLIETLEPSGGSEQVHATAKMPLTVLAVGENSAWVGLLGPFGDLRACVLLHLQTTKFGDKALARLPHRVLVHAVRATPPVGGTTLRTAPALLHLRLADSHAYTHAVEPEGRGSYDWGAFAHLTLPGTPAELVATGRQLLRVSLHENSTNGDSVAEGVVDTSKLQHLNCLQLPLCAEDDEDEEATKLLLGASGMGAVANALLGGGDHLFNVQMLLTPFGFAAERRWLEVDLQQGSNIRGNSGRAMAPFATISLGEHAHTSSTLSLSHNSNPKWNEAFCFDVGEAAGSMGAADVVLIDIHDSEQGGKIVGHAEIPIETLRAGRSTVEVALTNPHNGVACGAIEVELNAQGFGLPSRVLEVFVGAGKNIKNPTEISDSYELMSPRSITGRQLPPNSVCEVEIAGVVRRTDVQMATETPRWNQSFEYQIQDPNAAQLVVRVWRTNASGEVLPDEDPLGEATLRLDHLHNGADHCWVPLLIPGATGQLIPAEGEPMVRLRLTPHAFHHDLRRVDCTVLNASDLPAALSARPSVRLRMQGAEGWVSTTPATARAPEWNEALRLEVDVSRPGSRGSGASRRNSAIPGRRQSLAPRRISMMAKTGGGGSAGRQGTAGTANTNASIAGGGVAGQQHSSGDVPNLEVEIVDTVTEAVLGRGHVVLSGLPAGENRVVVQLSKPAELGIGGSMARLPNTSSMPFGWNANNTNGAPAGLLTPSTPAMGEESGGGAGEKRSTVALLLTPRGFGDEQLRQDRILDAARASIAPKFLAVTVVRTRNMLAAVQALQNGRLELDGAFVGGRVFSDNTAVVPVHRGASGALGDQEYVWSKQGEVRLGEWFWNSALPRPINVGVYGDVPGGRLMLEVRDAAGRPVARGAVLLDNVAKCENDEYVPMEIVDASGHWYASNSQLHVRLTPSNFGDQRRADVLEQTKLHAEALGLQEQLARAQIERDAAAQLSDFMSKEQGLRHTADEVQRERKQREKRERKLRQMQEEEERVVIERAAERARHEVAVEETEAFAAILGVRSAEAELFASFWQQQRRRDAALVHQVVREGERTTRAQRRNRNGQTTQWEEDAPDAYATNALMGGRSPRLRQLQMGQLAEDSPRLSGMGSFVNAEDGLNATYGSQNGAGRGPRARQTGRTQPWQPEEWEGTDAPAMNGNSTHPRTTDHQTRRRPAAKAQLRLYQSMLEEAGAEILAPKPPDHGEAKAPPPMEQTGASGHRAGALAAVQNLYNAQDLHDHLYVKLAGYARPNGDESEIPPPPQDGNQIVGNGVTPPKPPSQPRGPAGPQLRTGRFAHTDAHTDGSPPNTTALPVQSPGVQLGSAWGSSSSAALVWGDLLNGQRPSPPAQLPLSPPVLLPVAPPPRGVQPSSRGHGMMHGHGHFMHGQAIPTIPQLRGWDGDNGSPGVMGGAMMPFYANPHTPNYRVGATSGALPNSFGTTWPNTARLAPAVPHAPPPRNDAPHTARAHFAHAQPNAPDIGVSTGGGALPALMQLQHRQTTRRGQPPNPAYSARSKSMPESRSLPPHLSDKLPQLSTVPSAVGRPSDISRGLSVDDVRLQQEFLEQEGYRQHGFAAYRPMPLYVVPQGAIPVTSMSPHQTHQITGHYVTQQRNGHGNYSRMPNESPGVTGEAEEALAWEDFQRRSEVFDQTVPLTPYGGLGLHL